MSRIKELQDKLDANLDELNKMKETATSEKRHMTPEETSKFAPLFTETQSLMDELEREKGMENLTTRYQKPAGQAIKPDTRPTNPTEFRSFGEFLTSVIRAEDVSIMPDPRLKRASGMNEAVPSEGGFAVAPQYTQQIFKKVWDESLFAGKCTRIPMSTNSLKMPYLKETSRADGSRYGGVRAYWAAEAASYTGSKPALGQIEANPHKLTALIYLTEELIADAPALEAFVGGVVGQELAFAVDAALVSGDGVGKPLGVNYADCLVSTSRAAANKITASTLLSAWERLPQSSMGKAEWYANQDTIMQLGQLSAGDGSQIWLPNFVGGIPATILGRPLHFSEHCSTLGTAGDVLLLDLSQYFLFDRQGVVGSSSIHVRFIYDELTLKFSMRLDGHAAWEGAVTPYSASAKTLTPIIRLAA